MFACNSSAQEADAGGWSVLGQSLLRGSLCFKNKGWGEEKKRKTDR